MKKRRGTNEPITENRSILKIGNSFYLCLPPEFVRAHGIRPGDKVPVTCNHLLKVIPNSER
jgi:antitoxin component of MazEF toxin-antitoxin module